MRECGSVVVSMCMCSRGCVTEKVGIPMYIHVMDSLHVNKSVKIFNAQSLSRIVQAHLKDSQIRRS